MAICKSVWKHNQHRIVHSDTVPLLLPETRLRFTLTKSDLPEHIRFLEDNHPLLKFIGESGETDVESWGVIVNSFAELEGCHLSFLEQFYKNNAKAWFVGPGLFHNDKVDNDIIRSLSTTILLDWLEGHVSVIYISFGSQAQVCDDDLNEIAMGLEMSGQDFLWAMKSKTWSPPNGWEDRVRNRGLIVREWVDQRSILAHKSVGGFLSHCGWNSVLESLSLGVPLLALPLNAEQPLNAKQVVDELGAGLRIETEGASGWQKMSIKRQAICDGVKELMHSKKGKMVRNKAKELGRAAREAVEKGGSSNKSLSELIDTLCATEIRVPNCK